MAPHRLSYVKTLVGAVGLAAVGFAAVHLAAATSLGPLRNLVVLIGPGVGLIGAGLAISATMALYRDRLQARSRKDLFNVLNASRSEEALGAANPELGILVRRVWRHILRRQRLLVGDVVEIRTLEEIQRTLDESGCLDGLPFMAEMRAFCGRRAQVYRCVDKIYDYGKSRRLRRVQNTVLLVGLRCNGGAHGGCQASCYLLWKEAWLKPGTLGGEVRRLGRASSPAASRNSTSTGPYTCQYTQLAAASAPMKRWDVRQDVRPLLTGNLTFSAFCVAMLTRLFNAAQAARGGAGYPCAERRSTQHRGTAAHGIAPRETVRVLEPGDIAATLDHQGRHRGLWFDRDMVRYCGQRYTVLKRVERLIDVTTGQMVEMKTACLILDGVESSGEFQRFCPQHEYPFWREAWLLREADERQATESLTS